MPTIKKRSSAAPKQQEQEIETLLHTVSAFIAKYRQPFMAALIAAAVAAVFGMGYAMLRSHQEQQAAPLLAAASGQYEAAGEGQADFQRPLELYRDVQKKYPSTESGAIAQYYIGNCLVNLGRTGEALQAYDVFAANYSSRKFLLALVQQRRGYVLKALGRTEDARKAFEQAEELAGPGAATVELARLFEASGKASEAQAKYKIVLDKLGGTSWSAEAMGIVQKISPAPAAGPAAK